MLNSKSKSRLKSSPKSKNNPNTPHQSDDSTHLEDNLRKSVAVKDNLEDMPLMEHLVELRSHLIKIMIAVGVVFLALVAFSRELYDLISHPLITILPATSTMIAIDPVANFMAPIRLSLFAAIFIAMPYILYQVWSFVAPGLYQHEKRIAIPILLSSIILFYTGVAFAYFIVLKRALAFLIAFSPSNVVPMTDIESYLAFVTKLLMIFGITFEIPVLVLILILSGVVSVNTLSNQRRYVILACFAAAGVMSPPDVPTMFMLAIPMMLLFELGLLLAKVLVKDKTPPQASEF